MLLCMLWVSMNALFSLVFFLLWEGLESLLLKSLNNHYFQLLSTQLVALVREEKHDASVQLMIAQKVFIKKSFWEGAKAVFVALIMRKNKHSQWRTWWLCLGSEWSLTWLVWVSGDLDNWDKAVRPSNGTKKARVSSICMTSWSLI